MKTSAKVFIWIGMVVQFFLIYPIVIGIFALKKIEESSAKEELQTFGLLTTFFCSFLGGIFMLNIKEDELNTSSENKIITKTIKEKVIIPDAELTNRERIIKDITRIGIFALCGLLLVCLVFSIIATAEYNGDSFVPLIFNGYLLLLFVPIMILFFINKQRLNKLVTILLSIFALTSVALIVFSIITNNHYAFINRTYYSDYYNRWFTYVFYGEGWIYWVVFGLACAITSISWGIILLNIISKQTKRTYKTVKKEVVKTSKIEIELNEVKRLLENKTITDEEFQKMRESIISKYYK